MDAKAADASALQTRGGGEEAEARRQCESPMTETPLLFTQLRVVT